MSFTNYFYCAVIKFYQLPVHQRNKDNLTAAFTCLHKLSEFVSFLVP